MANRIVDTSSPTDADEPTSDSGTTVTQLPPNAEIEEAVDFSSKAVPDNHIWFEASKSDKVNVGPSAFHHASWVTHEGIARRITCVACNICIPEYSRFHLLLRCKPTFRVYPQKLSETETRHHFIEKLGVEFSCHKCRKKFPKTQAVPVCSWCHQVYHPDCLNQDVREACCTLGPHSRLILPPSWVVKVEKAPLSTSLSLPMSGAKQPHRKLIQISSCPPVKNPPPISPDQSPQQEPIFSIIPQVLGASSAYPLLVFVHPKSGGGQGLTILKEFLWLLNPRQVFDLTKVKPEYALQLFQGTNVRVLCCGGDGTAGWVMSSMESLQLIKKPPIALLPLGTGNDLSRVSGWGASYTDESLSQILFQIEAASVRTLDRWGVQVTPLTSDVQIDASGTDDVPVQVMSNYFSIGADAHASLEFHQFRERNRDKTHSRLKNKFIYLKTGSIDFLKRTYLSMCDHIELVCDGTDYTIHIRNNNYAALVFLNIQSYAAGTDPWGTPNLKKTTLGLQSQNDGMLEVIGLKQSQISLLFVGGHGDRITQAREIRITSTQPIPVQVDGEPCLLNPSSILISLKFAANLLFCSSHKREREGNRFPGLRPPRDSSSLMLVLNVVTLGDYTDYNMDITQLRKAAVSQGYISCTLLDNLASLRDQVKQILQSHLNPAPSQWCYLNVSSGQKNTFIRIHPDQEELVTVQDLPSDAIYVLKLECVRSVSGTLSLISGIDLEADQDQEQVQPSDGVESPTFLEDKTGIEGVDTLEQKGSSSPDLSQQNKSDLEAFLYKACSEGDMQTVQKAHSLDVNLYCCDSQDRTPLHITASKGHRQVAQFLIDNYPPLALDIQDNNLKETALHVAASMGNRSICKMLIKAHASLILLDAKGRTPYQRSKQCSDFSLETYLWKHEQFQRGTKLEFNI